MTDKLQTNEPTDDLTVLGDFGAVAERPKSLDRNDLTGTEDISADELRLPRLSIAQGLSPQMIEGDPSYIAGLGMFDLFSDLTGENYKKGPLAFIPLRRDVRRIEFIPREDGGGIADLDVPPNDPRLKWTVQGGERVPPVATTFTEFVVFLLIKGRAPEPIVLSIKNTNKWNRRAADQLTTFIKLRNAPIYAGIYSVASSTAKNDQGQFGVFSIKNAGWIPKDTPQGAALYEHAEKFAKSLEGKVIAPPREPGEDDFDPAEIAREGKTGTEM